MQIISPDFPTCGGVGIGSARGLCSATVEESAKLSGAFVSGALGIPYEKTGPFLA